jgi:hypothetical protein
MSREAIRGLYGVSASEAAPVYHASLGEIGFLEPQLSRALIAYYASAFCLLRFIARFLGEDLGLDAAALKGIGQSIEANPRTSTPASANGRAASIGVYATWEVSGPGARRLPAPLP